MMGHIVTGKTLSYKVIGAEPDSNIALLKIQTNGANLWTPR